MVDNDKPAFAKAILKGYLKGTMFDNGKRTRRPARVKGRKADEAVGV